MKKPKKKTILAIGGHMDDNYLGVGGLALAAVKKGHRVVFVDTVSDYSNWPNLPKTKTPGHLKEKSNRVAAVAKKWGIELRRLGFPYMKVPDSEEFYAVIAAHTRDIRPDMLFFPWFDDTNRDHWKSGLAALYGCLRANSYLEEAPRMGWAAKEAYAYQLDAQCRHFKPEIYFDITDAFPELIKAASEFDKIYAWAHGIKPMTHKLRDGFTGKTFNMTGHARWKYALSAIRGKECGVPYAEAFHAYKRLPVQKALQI